jgi:hypothetical protein
VKSASTKATVHDQVVPAIIFASSMWRALGGVPVRIADHSGYSNATATCTGSRMALDKPSKTLANLRP